MSIGQVKEDINDVNEEENDDKVNVAEDNKIKHETLGITLTFFLNIQLSLPGRITNVNI